MTDKSDNIKIQVVSDIGFPHLVAENFLRVGLGFTGTLGFDMFLSTRILHFLFVALLCATGLGCSDDLESPLFDVEESEPFEPVETETNCSLDASMGEYRSDLSPCMSVDLEIGEASGVEFARATGCNRCDRPVFVSVVAAQYGEQIPRFEGDETGSWSLVQRSELLPLVGSIEGNEVRMIGGATSSSYDFRAIYEPLHLVQELGPGESIIVTSYHDPTDGTSISDLSRPLLFGLEASESKPISITDTFWYLRDLCLNGLTCDWAFIDGWDPDLQMPVDRPTPTRPEIIHAD